MYVRVHDSARAGTKIIEEKATAMREKTSILAITRFKRETKRQECDQKSDSIRLQ
jgi:hypothetical protein